MLFGLIVIFAVILFLAFAEESLGKHKWALLLLVGILLIVCAAARPIGFDRDSPNYENFYMHPDNGLSEISVEPSFLMICKACSMFSQDVRLVFILFAFLGVALKLYAIQKFRFMLFFPVLIYFSNFFMLHELTQIRVGVASALFLIAIPHLANGKRLVAFLILLLSCVFHYSALALLPFLFFDNSPLSRWKKIVLCGIIPVCYVMYMLDLDLLTTIPIPYVTDKVESYKMAAEFGLVDKAPLLNPLQLIKMAVFVWLLFFEDTISYYLSSIHILIKMLACSLFVYFAFSSITIVSMRISELYGVIEMIVYPCIIYTIRPQFIGKMAVVIIALLEIFTNTVLWEYFDFDV